MGNVNSKKLENKVNERVQVEFRDEELEQQLLAYIVRETPTMVSQVQADWFTNIVHQEILEVVRDLRLTLTDKGLYRELKERGYIKRDDRELYSEILEDLYDLDITGITTKTALHMGHQILKLYEFRRIYEYAGQMISTMGDVDLDTIKKSLRDLSRPVQMKDFAKEGYYLEDFEERKIALEVKKQEIEASEQGSAGIPTGIPLFDHKTGGVMRKEFGVIAGIPGVGKTAGILSFGLHAFKLGYNVLIVSGEMSKLNIEYRIDSNLAGISGNKFRKAELSKEDFDHWATTIQRYSITNDNYLYVKAYPRRFTFADVEETILQLQEETGKPLDWLGADYLNIIDPIQKNRYGSRMGWEQQAEVVWDFKALVEEYNLVGWTGNQVKDEAFEKELYELADLKYGRAIPEASPIVVAMIRTEKDELAKRMKLQVLKMRNAPSMPKPLVLSPNMEFMRLHDRKIGESKSLADVKSGYLDATPKKVHTRPARSLKK